MRLLSSKDFDMNSKEGEVAVRYAKQCRQLDATRRTSKKSIRKDTLFVWTVPSTILLL